MIYKYAAVAAKKYNFKEEDIRDTLKQVIPFTPVGPPTPIVYCGKKLTSFAGEVLDSGWAHYANISGLACGPA